MQQVPEYCDAYDRLVTDINNYDPCRRIFESRCTLQKSPNSKQKKKMPVVLQNNFPDLSYIDTIPLYLQINLY